MFEGEHVFLAPVPAIHLVDALDKVAKYGRVAFGSNAFEFFREKAKEGQPIRVRAFIYPSSTGSLDAPNASLVGRVAFEGVLDCWRGATLGKHVDGDVRPASAEQSDTRWALFWEVIDLRQLKPTWALSRFRTKTGGPFKGLHGPTWARLI